MNDPFVLERSIMAKEYANSICEVYAKAYYGKKLFPGPWKLYRVTMQARTPVMLNDRGICKGGGRHAWMKSTKQGKKMISASLWPNIYANHFYEAWVLDMSLYNIPHDVPEIEVESEIIHSTEILLWNTVEDHIILAEMEVL